MESSSESPQSVRRSPSRGAAAGESRDVRPCLLLPVTWNTEHALEKAEIDSGGVSSAEEKTGRASVGGSTATSDTSCFVSALRFSYSACDDGGDTASPQSVISHVEARPVQTPQASATPVAEQFGIKVAPREPASSQKFFVSRTRSRNDHRQSGCDGRESERVGEGITEQQGRAGVEHRSPSVGRWQREDSCQKSLCGFQTRLRTGEALPRQPSTAGEPRRDPAVGPEDTRDARDQLKTMEVEDHRGWDGADTVRRGKDVKNNTLFCGPGILGCAEAAAGEERLECLRPGENKSRKCSRQKASRETNLSDEEACKGTAREQNGAPSDIAISLVGVPGAPCDPTPLTDEQQEAPEVGGVSCACPGGVRPQFHLSPAPVNQQLAADPFSVSVSLAEGEAEFHVPSFSARGCTKEDVGDMCVLRGTNSKFFSGGLMQGDSCGSRGWECEKQCAARGGPAVSSCSQRSFASVRLADCVDVLENCTASALLQQRSKRGRTCKARSRSLQSDCGCLLPRRLYSAEEQWSSFSSRIFLRRTQGCCGQPVLRSRRHRSERRFSSVAEKQSTSSDGDSRTGHGSIGNRSGQDALSPVWFPSRSPRMSPIVLSPSSVSLRTVTGLARTTGGRTSRENRPAKESCNLDESPSSGNTNAGMSGPTTRTSGSLERDSSQASRSAVATEVETGGHSGEMPVIGRRRWASFDVMDSEFDFDKSNEEDGELGTPAETEASHLTAQGSSPSRTSRVLAHLLEKRSNGPRPRPGNRGVRSRACEPSAFAGDGGVGPERKDGGLSSIKSLIDTAHRGSDTWEAGVYRGICTPEKSVVSHGGPFQARRQEVDEVGSAGWSTGTKKGRRRHGGGGAAKRTSDSLQHRKANGGSLPSFLFKNQNRFSALSSAEETSPSSALSNATGTIRSSSRSREVSLWESDHHVASEQEKRTKNCREDLVSVHASLSRRDKNRHQLGSGLLAAPFGSSAGCRNQGIIGSSHTHQMGLQQGAEAGLFAPESLPTGQSRSALLGACPVPGMEGGCDMKTGDAKAPVAALFDGFELFRSPLTVQLLGGTSQGVMEGVSFVEEQHVADRDEKGNSTTPADGEAVNRLLTSANKSQSGEEQVGDAKDSEKAEQNNLQEHEKDDLVGEENGGEGKKEQQKDASDQGWIVAGKKRKPVADKKRQQEAEARKIGKNKRPDLASRLEWVAWLDPCSSAAKSSGVVSGSAACSRHCSLTASVNHINSGNCTCPEKLKGEGGVCVSAPALNRRCAACCTERVSFERKLQEEYEQGLQKIAELSSWRAVAPFLAWWTPAMSGKPMYNLCLFKSPVKPLWEHSDNIGGGHFALRRFSSRSMAQEMFRMLASLVLREDTPPCVAVHCNGVVYCARQHWRKLKIEFWTGCVENAVLAQQEALLRRLAGQLPSGGSDVDVSFALHTAVVHKNQQKILRAARSKGRLTQPDGGVLRVPLEDGAAPPPPSSRCSAGAAVNETVHSRPLPPAAAAVREWCPSSRVLAGSSNTTTANRAAWFDKEKSEQNASLARYSQPAPLRRSVSADPTDRGSLPGHLTVCRRTAQGGSQRVEETPTGTSRRKKLANCRLPDRCLAGPRHEVRCPGRAEGVQDSASENQRGATNKLGSRSWSCMGRLSSEVRPDAESAFLSCVTTEWSRSDVSDFLHAAAGGKHTVRPRSAATGFAADPADPGSHVGGVRTSRTPVHSLRADYSGSRSRGLPWGGDGLQEESEGCGGALAVHVQRTSSGPSSQAECLRRSWTAAKSLPPTGDACSPPRTDIAKSESVAEMAGVSRGNGGKEAAQVPLRKCDAVTQSLSQLHQLDLQGVQSDKRSSLLPPPKTSVRGNNFGTSSPLLRPGHFLRPLSSAGFAHGSRRGFGTAPVYPAGWARGGARYGRGVLQRGEEEGMYRRQAPAIVGYRGSGGAGLAGSSRGGSFSRGGGRANGASSTFAAPKTESLLGSRQCLQPRPSLLGGQEVLGSTYSPTVPGIDNNSWWGANGTVMRCGLNSDEQRQKLISQISRIDVKSIPDYFTMQLSANLGTACRGVSSATVPTGAVLTPGSGSTQLAMPGLVSNLVLTSDTVPVPAAEPGHTGQTTWPQQGQLEPHTSSSWPAVCPGWAVPASCLGGAHMLSPSVGIAVARVLQAQQPPVSPLMHAVQQQLGLQVGSPQPPLLPPAFSMLGSSPGQPQEFMLPPLAQSFQVSDLSKSAEAPSVDGPAQEFAGCPLFHKGHSMESSEVETLLSSVLPVQSRLTEEKAEDAPGGCDLAAVKDEEKRQAPRPFTFNPQATVFQPTWRAAAQAAEMHMGGRSPQELLAETECSNGA
ncbi:eukaryotic initiation factor 4e [Cystoisospora suis]|uniref:Eukaryotic initiation factor 4e n=1 Tax=Cystoisospora suis TaxID=483139 RepID=A0A2C6JDT0_9APIC|nr:eukaryotic initiation factor 4e [Cystoisospora suis]